MQIKNLTMSFGTQVLFENINLNIPENEKVGVVGVNGAGKTTFFKIVRGLEYPDEGKVILKNGSRVSWLPQVITDDVETLNINVLDYLMMGRPIDKLNTKLQSLYDELANLNCDQNKVYGEIDKIQKQLEYWDVYNAESILLKIIDGMNIAGTYYQPTFYYEFLWCLLGFVILLCVRKFYEYLKVGQLTGIYLMWYGIGRFFVESLRTDSLMLKEFKVAQIVSVIMFVVGLIMLILGFKGSKFENRYDDYEIEDIKF